MTIERYGTPIDRARHGSHLYTDKAPGLSLVAVPAVAAVRLAERVSGQPRVNVIWESTARLHVVRVLVVAPFLLLLAWLVGRVAEGLAPRTGAAAAVGLALGTMLGPLSTVLFAHVPETCLGFAAFVILARARSHWMDAAGGALAGAAVLMDYEAGLVAVGLAVYVIARRGPRASLAYIVGSLPAAAVLGAYNTLAFGSPVRLSYDFKDGPNAEEHGRAFFGIGRPDLDAVVTTLFSERGLLTISPMLALGVIGLVLLWRRGLHLEAATALGLVSAYVLLEAGYFDPLGGISPGPRFLAPAVPFLILGVAMVLGARPAPAALLVALSVAISVWNAFTWFELEDVGWPKTVWSLLGAPRVLGIAVVAVVTGAALALALRRSGVRAEKAPELPGLHWRA